MIIIPKKFDDMLSGIKRSLKGKKNPKTDKPFTDSDMVAIARQQYRKQYGKDPLASESAEILVAENVRVNFNSFLEVRE